MSGGKISKLRPRPGSRLDLFMRGELTVDDLTDEELESGILNDKNGERTSRPSNLVPREFHQAVVARLIQVGEGKFRSAFLEATEQMIDIALGDPVKESTTIREGNVVETMSKAYDPVVLKAAQYVIERVAGKIPDEVNVSGQVLNWQADLGDIFTTEPVAQSSTQGAPRIRVDDRAPGNGAGH